MSKIIERHVIVQFPDRLGLIAKHNLRFFVDHFSYFLNSSTDEYLLLTSQLFYLLNCRISTPTLYLLIVPAPPGPPARAVPGQHCSLSYQVTFAIA